MCRPYGTLSSVVPNPALKRWANLCCALRRAELTIADRLLNYASLRSLDESRQRLHILALLAFFAQRIQRLGSIQL